MQDGTADQLNIEVAHAQRAAADFTNQGECGNQRRFGGFAQTQLVIRIGRVELGEAGLDFGLQLRRHRRKFGVGELFHLRLEGVDGFDDRVQGFHVAFVLGADETRDDAIDDFLYVHILSVGAFEPRMRALLDFRSQGAEHRSCRIARLT